MALRDVPRARISGAPIHAEARSSSASPTTPGGSCGAACPTAPISTNSPRTNERGLLGNFIGANLGAQYEAVMCDWVNLGLQDPDITGANDR